MRVRPEVIPFIIAAAIFGAIVSTTCVACTRSLPISLCTGVAAMLVLAAYFLYFFRDPDRIPPEDPTLIVSGAEGHVHKITTLSSDAFADMARFAGLQDGQWDRFGTGDVIRISIFLSLFDVHVNRFPIGGTSTFLGYFPGKHLFTFTEKSSDVNQHNSILVENDQTCCLVNQIVGPVCRRVVYWLDHDEPTTVERGGIFGMMKFGSRLDMYLPADDCTILATEGQRVRAGETPVARLKEDTP